VTLIDLAVVRGEPRTVELRLPDGYQLMGTTGSSLETSEPVDNRVVLTLADPTARHHQFLVSLERPHIDGSFSLETGLVQVSDTQRERGEIAVEGAGALDLEATERPGMHRIDIRELNPALPSLARTPLLAAFRYQRTPSSVPGLALAVTRFPDSGVLAAMVDRLAATTVITSEGRALTEVRMWVKNHAQPFVKVSLPPGATMVSAEVAGEPAKPVTGDDGSRVPLLRPGFRPAGLYSVSFVYLHAGMPFGRKGDLFDDVASDGHSDWPDGLGTVCAGEILDALRRRQRDPAADARTSDRPKSSIFLGTTGSRFILERCRQRWRHHDLSCAG